MAVAYLTVAIHHFYLLFEEIALNSLFLTVV
ncbi:hypothetical protein VAA_01131 [Vibrio anguillarum 775]|nr:hypothetical protein VAA_01131 [Vibrio anguillarum 775]